MIKTSMGRSLGDAEKRVEPGWRRADEKRLARRWMKMVNSIVRLSTYVPKATECSRKTVASPALMLLSSFLPLESPLPETQPHRFSNDTLFDGRLICRQGCEGYRFSVDAVLAAHFPTLKPGQRVLDLGCGCGVIGLILAHRHAHITIGALELQPELAALAADNVRCNGFADRFQVACGDVRAAADYYAPESADCVVCNPPYGKPGSGRINLHDQAAQARHELNGSIDDFIRASAFCVKNRGMVTAVYPARRCNALLAALHAHKLTPKRLQPVYSYPGAENARLVLVEAVKNGGEQFEILAPFYIYERKNGDYAPAMLALYKD